MRNDENLKNATTKILNRIPIYVCRITYEEKKKLIAIQWIVKFSLHFDFFYLKT